MNESEYRIAKMRRALFSRYGRESLSYEEASKEMGLEVKEVKELLKSDRLRSLNIKHIANFIEREL